MGACTLTRWFTVPVAAFLSVMILLAPVTALAGSIALLDCSGVAATWRHSPVTVRIDNVAGLGSSQVAAVVAAIPEWNNVLSGFGFTGFQLSQVSSGSADIVIQLYYKITPGYILGATSITCASDNSLTSASILLGLKGLSLTGIQNVAAHELGHAIGLGHANLQGDLMYASLDKTERKALDCPSNLDEGGIALAYNNYPYTTLSYSVANWQHPSSC